MTYSHLEDFVLQIYRYLAIYQPEQINVVDIAQKMGIKLHYDNFSLRYDNYIVIKKSTKQKEWQDFAHELGHYLRHEGNQMKMFPMFRELQEYQADSFSYHFCVPTFMLDQLYHYDANDIARRFNVEYQFAYRRLEMYQSKIFGGVFYGKRILQEKR